MLGSMGDTRALAMAGVTVGGVRCRSENFFFRPYLFLEIFCVTFLLRYMYLSGDDQVIRARKKTSGLHKMKTVQAVIIAVYESTVPEQWDRQHSGLRFGFWALL